MLTVIQVLEFKCLDSSAWIQVLEFKCLNSSAWIQVLGASRPYQGQDDATGLDGRWMMVQLPGSPSARAVSVLMVEIPSGGFPRVSASFPLLVLL